MDTAPDSEVIQKARQGDSAAIGRLWARYEPRVQAVCRHYMEGPNRDPATDADDLANETFIQFLHSLDGIRDRDPGTSGFEVWLLEIARRTCIRALTRHQRRRQWHAVVSAEVFTGIEDTCANVARLAEEQDSLTGAAREINTLSETYRLPFKLCLEGYSHKEIAQR